MIKKDTSDLKFKYLNSGVFGNCYLTEDREVYKEFKFQVPDYVYDTLTRLSQMNFDSFVTPNELIYSDLEAIETFKGYIMRYSKGVDFNNIYYSTLMSNFLMALSKLESDIIDLSKEKFQIYDFKAGNVFYTRNDKIDVLDMDLYRHNDAIDERSIVRCNLMELEFLLDSSFIQQNPRKFASDRLLELYNSFSDGKLLGSTYIYEIMQEIRRASGEEVTTYKDFNNGMRLIMKNR